MTGRESPVASGIPGILTELHPDEWTAPFWAAAAAHRLVVPRCKDCSTFRMPPAPFCWNCQSQSVEWVELGGRGSVYSYTIARQPLVPALAAAVPYVVALVDLDEAPGIRLVLTVVDADPESVDVGHPVEIVWEDYDGARAIPRARLVDD